MAVDFLCVLCPTRRVPVDVCTQVFGQHRMAENYPFPQQRGPSTTPPNLPHICSGKTRPPHFPTPCTIEWAALRDVELLRHGTGTSLYTATFQGDAVVVKTPAVGLKAQAIFDVVGLSCFSKATTRRGQCCPFCPLKKTATCIR
jgi:hypothetical protein